MEVLLNFDFSGSSGDKTVEPNRYLMKMKRQERVIEEVKLVMKPYYSKRTITKEQYKEILRKAVPKVIKLLKMSKFLKLNIKTFHRFVTVAKLIPRRSKFSSIHT